MSDMIYDHLHLIILFSFMCRIRATEDVIPRMPSAHLFRYFLFHFSKESNLRCSGEKIDNTWGKGRYLNREIIKDISLLYIYLGIVNSKCV